MQLIHSDGKTTYSYQLCRISFLVEICYEKDGRLQKIRPKLEVWKDIPCKEGLDLCDTTTIDKWNNEDIEIYREISYIRNSSEQFRMRICIRNIGDGDIRLHYAAPVVIEGQKNIQVGSEPITDNFFYRQGRHKNDLPSICKIGVYDESFEDAIGSVLETGTGQEKNESTYQIVSDQLTVIKSSKDEEAQILFGFLTGNNQFFESILLLNPDRSFKSFVCKTDYNIRLVQGATVEGEWLRIDCRQNLEQAIEDFVCDKARINNALRSKTPPAVYCTWYYYGQTVTYEDVKENLDEIVRKKLPFDVFQIDDGWEVAVGDWRNNEKFPKPMKNVADEIREAGLIPGIWTSPFITDRNAPIVSENYEYILKNSKGEPCLFPMNDRIFYILDITNPEVISLVRQLYHMLRYDWGFIYHKLDFTRAPLIQEDAVFYDDTITLVEAYRAAVQAVRDGIGEDAYFLMCGGLYDPLIGIVNGQRIGSDVLSMWSSNIQKGGKTAPFTIKQNLLRYFMNHWWDNDPDSLMVRRQEKPSRGLRLTYGLLNDEEVKTSVLNQYLGGGMICSTEPLKTISDDRLFQLKHIIPVENVKVVPLDLFSGKRYPSLIKVHLPKQRAFQLCYINWSDEETIPVKLTLNKEVLGDYYQNNKTYTVAEFFSGNIIRGIKCNETIEPGNIKPHGSILIKVIVEDDEPYVLHSNAHFSMGEEVEKLQIVGDELVFEMNYLFETPSTYIVGLPEGVTCHEKGSGYQGKGDIVEIEVNQRRKYSYKIKVSK